MPLLLLLVSSLILYLSGATGVIGDETTGVTGKYVTNGATDVTGNIPLVFIGNDATAFATGVTGICATVEATGVIDNYAAGVAIDIAAGDADGDASARSCPTLYCSVLECTWYGALGYPTKSFHNPNTCNPGQTGVWYHLRGVIVFLGRIVTSRSRVGWRFASCLCLHRRKQHFRSVHDHPNISPSPLCNALYCPLRDTLAAMLAMPTLRAAFVWCKSGSPESFVVAVL